MATLDSSIVNIALPTLTKELSTNLHQVKWVVIVYLLAVTILLLPFGRLSDIYGRKVVFQLGFVIFTIGSGLCGLAPHLTWLVIFRAVQAIGASMLMVNGPAIISATFLNRDRGSALGILAMVVSAGLISGPSVGGVLIAHTGWPSIFLVNIPFGIIGVFLVHRFLRHEGFHAVRHSMTFDWAGAIIQTVILVMAIVIFDPPQVSFSGSVPVPISRWFLGIMIILTSLLFIRVERSVKAPLFDLSLMKNRTFWIANLAGFLSFVALSAVSVLMPFFLEEVLHLSPKEAGLFMTAIPVTVFVVAPISGRLSDHLGSQGLSFSGAMIGAIGMFIMAGVFGPGFQSESTHMDIVMGLCLIGLSIGLFQSPNNNAIMGCVPTSKLGVASALLATVRNLGLVTGTGMATSLFTWRMRVTQDFVLSFHTTLAVAGVIGVGAMLTSVVKRKPHHEQGHLHGHGHGHSPTGAKFE